MMTYAAGFWPFFWMIIGGGALLTVLAALLVATFSPAWLGWRQPASPPRSHETDASHEAPPRHLPKAA